MYELSWYTCFHLCSTDGDGQEADAASSAELRDDESNVGMAAGARVSLDRVERHRLPAALLAALLAGGLGATLWLLAMRTRLARARSGA